MNELLLRIATVSHRLRYYESLYESGDNRVPWVMVKTCREELDALLKLWKGQ